MRTASGQVVTVDRRDRETMVEELNARNDALVAQLAETKRIAEWAIRELARLRREIMVEVEP